jgi:hypothetical protein
MVDVVGKILVALGVGALLSPWLLSWALSFIIVGLAFTVAVKAKYWKKFWS